MTFLGKELTFFVNKKSGADSHTPLSDAALR
jgi:hypothetical protein